MGLEHSAIGFNEATQTILNNAANYVAQKQAAGITPTAQSLPRVYSPIGATLADSVDLAPAIEREDPFNTLINRPQSQYDDTLVLNSRVGTTLDGADDGKISFKEKITNFGKGIVNPIKKLFTSPKAAMGAIVSVAAASALVAATGGAAAPVLIAAGIAAGGIQIGVNARRASKATTDEQARKAWQGMGTGTLVTATSIAGAKSALKCTGADTTGMSFTQAALQCIKNAPKGISNSVKSFTSGAYIANLKAYFSTAPVEGKKPEAKQAPEKPGEVEVLTPEVITPPKSKPVHERGSMFEPEDIIDAEFTEI